MWWLKVYRTCSRISVRLAHGLYLVQGPCGITQESIRGASVRIVLLLLLLRPCFGIFRSSSRNDHRTPSSWSVSYRVRHHIFCLSFWITHCRARFTFMTFWQYQFLTCLLRFRRSTVRCSPLDRGQNETCFCCCRRGPEVAIVSMVSRLIESELGTIFHYCYLVIVMDQRKSSHKQRIWQP